MGPPGLPSPSSGLFSTAGHGRDRRRRRLNLRRRTTAGGAADPIHGAPADLTGGEDTVWVHTFLKAMMFNVSTAPPATPLRGGGSHYLVSPEAGAEQLHFFVNYFGEMKVQEGWLMLAGQTLPLRQVIGSSPQVESPECTPFSPFAAFCVARAI